MVERMRVYVTFPQHLEENLNNGLTVITSCCNLSWLAL